MLKVAKSVSPKTLTEEDCIPVGSGPFEEIKTFEWNVEAFVTKKVAFPYYVGEGPLYWYRIDWYPSICPDQTPAPITPTISYIAPNCPYEIIENCIILPPDCPCDPPCPPSGCSQRDIEVWHMPATSVIHLCERINQECCHRKPPGFMRRVRQYMRPTLCCDVPWPAPDSIDRYKDVDFILCECGNLVDPCIQRFIYPEHINRCGIHGPAYTGPDPIPASTIALTADIFGAPIMMATEVDATATEMAPLPPPVKQVAPVNRIINRFGPSIPEVVHCYSNLNELLNAKFDNFDFLYNADYKSWQGNKRISDWKLTIEWAPTQETEQHSCGFRFNMVIEKIKNNKSLKTKVLLNVKLSDMLDTMKDFNLEFSFNTKTSILICKKNATLQSKIISDDLGILKNGFILKVKLKG